MGNATSPIKADKFLWRALSHVKAPSSNSQPETLACIKSKVNTPKELVLPKRKCLYHQPIK